MEELDHENKKANLKIKLLTPAIGTNNWAR